MRASSISARRLAERPLGMGLVDWTKQCLSGWPAAMPQTEQSARGLVQSERWWPMLSQLKQKLLELVPAKVKAPLLEAAILPVAEVTIVVLETFSASA